MALANYPWSRRRRQSVRFRGLAFEVLETGRGVGRRSQTHTYPGAEEPFTEDLGRAPRGYKLEAIVAGPDYDRELAALLLILEKPGRGKLELYYGRPVWVVVQSARIAERSSEQGFARVSIEFVEAGRPRNPAAGIAGRSLLERGRDLVVAAAEAAFPVIAANIAEIVELGSAMEERASELAEELSATLVQVDENAGIAENAASAIQSFVDNVSSLARSPVALATGVSGIVDELASIPGDLRRGFDSMVELAGWGDTLEAVSTTSSLGTLEAANQEAIGALVAELAASHAAAISARLAFASAEDSTEHRDELAALLDTILLAAADADRVEVYRELRSVKASTIADLNSRATRLPVRFSMTLPAPKPSLVLAFRLYGDTSRGEDIAARNGVRHPSFVVAGEPLEVLSPLSSDAF